MHHQHQFELAGLKYQFETGKFANQADGSVFLTVGDCQILATVCWDKDLTKQNDFFPLTVNYQEKYYAGGRFPGGFKKREGAPSENEILKCRIIDRTLRPTFPKTFNQEVQVIVNVMSIDPSIETDVPALLAASAALRLTGMPTNTVVCGARVIKDNDQFIINPSIELIKKAKLDIFVSGNGTDILMVEAGALEASEEDILKALEMANAPLQTCVNEIEAFAAKVGVENVVLPEIVVSEEETKIAQAIEGIRSELEGIANMTVKGDRNKAFSALKEKHITALSNDFPEAEAKISHAIDKAYQAVVRENVLVNQKRIDGRKLDEVRHLEPGHGILKRAHGSGSFIRGETSSLTALTLGSGDKDAQIIDAAIGESKDRFLLHYNFPPFATGECGFVGSPKRREIGHGNLAKKALIPLMPSIDEFPYSIRLVSEILDSNGSSSMATVCASSLALMDAGVPIKQHIAGIAMGLVKDDKHHRVLTDILGDEDHLGDMDFKVAGTTEGVTALQMDIKIPGINHQILHEALMQAKEARLHILKAMNAVIDAPRTEISAYAPRITSFNIKPDKIKVVIGKGGSTIKEITEKFGVTIDINDDGLIKINSTDSDKAAQAMQYIKDLVADVEVGQEYTGTINKILDFGAFVKLPVGKDGFLHISQVSNEHVYDINEHLKLNDEVNVVVIEIDRQNRIKLGLKDLKVTEK
jgi:polyribonucleotide nucleotidyltransferase